MGWEVLFLQGHFHTSKSLGWGWGQEGMGHRYLLGLSLPIWNLSPIENIAWNYWSLVFSYYYAWGRLSVLWLWAGGESESWISCLIRVSTIELGRIKGAEAIPTGKKSLSSTKIWKKASSVQFSTPTWNRVFIALNWEKWEVGNSERVNS